MGVATLRNTHTMQNSPNPPHDLIAPTIQPNEARKRMRKLERALNTANEAVQIARG